jgi:hypothetical protein
LVSIVWGTAVFIGRAIYAGMACFALLQSDERSNLLQLALPCIVLSKKTTLHCRSHAIGSKTYDRSFIQLDEKKTILRVRKTWNIHAYPSLAYVESQYVYPCVNNTNNFPLRKNDGRSFSLHARVPYPRRATGKSIGNFKRRKTQFSL